MEPILNLPQILVIIGLVLVLSELFIGIQTGFDLVLIGSSLILGGTAGILTNNTSVALALSIILSTMYIFYGRTIIKKKLIVLTHSTNIDRLIGETGTVIRSITPDTAGLIRLDDEDWRASADEILYEKDKVKVISLEGVTLKVKKV